MLVEAYMGGRIGEVQVMEPLIIQENGENCAEIKRIYHQE